MCDLWVLDYDPEFGMGEEMFKDLALSRESMREYHSKLDENNPGQKLNGIVLQRSAWPFTVQKHAVDLPPNVRLISLSSWGFWSPIYITRCKQSSQNIVTITSLNTQDTYSTGITRSVLRRSKGGLALESKNFRSACIKRSCYSYSTNRLRSRSRM